MVAQPQTWFLFVEENQHFNQFLKKKDALEQIYSSPPSYNAPSTRAPPPFVGWLVWFIVFNATSNNISVILTVTPFVKPDFRCHLDSIILVNCPLKKANFFIAEMDYCNNTVFEYGVVVIVW